MNKKVVKLLSSRDETINLYWPLFCLLLCCALRWFGGEAAIAGRYEGLALFIVGTVFLNTLHNAFTYFMIGTYPEIGDWVRARNAKRWIGLYWEWSLVFLALFFFFLWCFAHWWLLGDSDFHWPLLVVSILPVHHTYKQIYGISSAYNQRLRENAADDRGLADKIARGEAQERFLFRVFLGAVILGMCGALAPPLAQYQKLFSWIGLITGLSVLLLLVNSLFYFGKFSGNKTKYLARLLLFPLAPLGPHTFGLISSLLHGVEYLLVTKQMKAASQATSSTKSMLVLLAVLVFLALGCLVNPLAGYGKVVLPLLSTGAIQAAAVLLAALSLTISYHHYYLDRQLFRFSDPLNRKFIAPLLAKDLE